MGDVGDYWREHRAHRRRKRANVREEDTRSTEQIKSDLIAAPKNAFGDDGSKKERKRRAPAPSLRR